MARGRSSATDFAKKLSERAHKRASLMVVACTGGADNGAVQTTLGDAAPATPTETTTTTSESQAATTTEAPLVGESSLDSPIQLGAVVQVGSWTGS